MPPDSLRAISSFAAFSPFPTYFLFTFLLVEVDTIFFGLSLRQFLFSIVACAVAVILYFTFRPYFGIETLSWLCILGAAPFAALGFIKYNGMNAEEFVFAYIKSEFLIPKKLSFNPTNFYQKLITEKQKGDEKVDEDNKNSI